jgi:hypothetical protein
MEWPTAHTGIAINFECLTYFYCGIFIEFSGFDEPSLLPADSLIPGWAKKASAELRFPKGPAFAAGAVALPKRLIEASSSPPLSLDAADSLGEGAATFRLSAAYRSSVFSGDTET